MRMFQAPTKKGEYKLYLLVLVRVQFREYIGVLLEKKKTSLCDFLKCDKNLLQDIDGHVKDDVYDDNDKNLLQNIDGHVEVVILHR